MSENAVPVRTVDVILNFYRLEVLTGEEAKHLTKSDLTPTPKPEAIQTVYMRVLHLLFRFTPECHFMVPLLQNIQHPEYQEGVTGIISVYVRMRQFLPMCFVYDFALNDLLAPKKQRTLFILSAIMNYLQFRKLRLNVLAEKQTKIRASLDMQQTYAKRVQEAETKIAKLSTIPPEQQAEASKLDAALSELNTIIKNEYKEVNTINDSITEWKSKVAEKTQKLAQAKMDVNNTKENITKLKSQIVESPEELKIQMEKMRKDVKNIKSSIEQADEFVVELQNMVHRVTHTDLEIQQMYSLLQELEIGMNDRKQEYEERLQFIAQDEKKQKDLKNLCKEEEQLKRSLGMKLDKEIKQNIRRQKEKEAKEQHIKNVLGQCKQVHQKREEKADQIKEISRESQQLKVQIQSLKDVSRKQTEAAQAMYGTLSAAMDELDGRIEMQILNLKEDAIKMSANFPL
ncbi:kinetochore protein Nuf2 [Phycodurus eques]|uniref:kinetochore protein Nuf2 n=1 Tax=Phycodurus eques TaxID=693459 RepID=UPI002ACE0630|nr:kinetochore protein Nuf2 [Phycodurus eques]